MRVFKAIGLAGVALLPLVSTGCTAKYQERIGDLNDRIAQFQGELTAKQAENRELMGRVRRLKAENEALRKQPRPTREPKPEKLGGGAVFDPATGKLTIPNRVSFTPGSFALSKEGKATLRKVASFLKQRFPGKRIYVMGHTDNQPLNKTRKKYTSNRDLAARRAEAVALYLIQQGFPRRAIAIVGYGESNPVLPNTTEKGRATNRRTEIAIGKKL